MNLDKELKQKLLEKNGLNEERSTDKIQEYLVERWKGNEKRMKQMRRIVIGLWIVTVFCFFFDVYIMPEYNTQAFKFLENYSFETVGNIFIFIVKAIAPILPLIATLSTIIYIVRFYSHKHQFNRLVGQSNFNKRIERIESMLENLLEERKSKEHKE